MVESPFGGQGSVIENEVVHTQAYLGRKVKTVRLQFQVGIQRQKPRTGLHERYPASARQKI